MRTAARFDLKTPARLIGYLVLGGLGSVALLVPLAGVLSYLAVPFYPVLLGWFLYGGLLAVTRHLRMARIYLFANLGILVATLIASAASLIRIAVSAQQPDTALTAPLYLALVLVGLGVGSAFGARRRRPTAQSH
ncbi:MAG TPA: hypothetical protein VN895_06995 [Candidatus Acidoferrum sp.]|nr:hypothetical protein [Candidatus Acidoferrum sp.]